MSFFATFNKVHGRAVVHFQWPFLAVGDGSDEMVSFALQFPGIRVKSPELRLALIKPLGS